MDKEEIECLIHKYAWIDTDAKEIWVFSTETFFIKQLHDGTLKLHKFKDDEQKTKIAEIRYTLVECKGSHAIIAINGEHFRGVVQGDRSDQLVLNMAQGREIHFERYPKRV